MTMVKGIGHLVEDEVLKGHQKNLPSSQSVSIGRKSGDIGGGKWTRVNGGFWKIVLLKLNHN